MVHSIIKPDLQTMALSLKKWFHGCFHKSSLKLDERQMEESFLGAGETCFSEISDLTVNLGYASFKLYRCQNFEIMVKKMQ